MMIVRIFFLLNFIIIIIHIIIIIIIITTTTIIIKSEIWIISQWLGLGNETMVDMRCIAVCNCIMKNDALKKTYCSVNMENHIFPNIFIFKTCHLYLDTGSNIYIAELSVGHRASISSLSLSIISDVFLYRCFSLTLFWKHILTCWNIQIAEKIP